MPFIFNVMAGAICMLACAGIADTKWEDKDLMGLVFLVVMLFGVANFISAGVVFVQNVIL